MEQLSFGFPIYQLLFASLCFLQATVGECQQRLRSIQPSWAFCELFSAEMSSPAFLGTQFESTVGVLWACNCMACVGHRSVTMEPIVIDLAFHYPCF